MKTILSTICLLLICAFAQAQTTNTNWYSEHESNGLLIQTSYPKGGPYTGPTSKHYNYSYLVFYARVVNQTEDPIALQANFAADPIPIPNSPNTFVKVFLPPDTMTAEKHDLFSYGVTRLASFDQPTNFQRTIAPHEECFFYTVAVFYQTNQGAFNSERGGNRAEYVLKGNTLLFNLLPQIDAFACGTVEFKK